MLASAINFYQSDWIDNYCAAAKEVNAGNVTDSTNIKNQTDFVVAVNNFFEQ